MDIMLWLWMDVESDVDNDLVGARIMSLDSRLETMKSRRRKVMEPARNITNATDGERASEGSERVRRLV